MPPPSPNPKVAPRSLKKIQKKNFGDYKGGVNTISSTSAPNYILSIQQLFHEQALDMSFQMADEVLTTSVLYTKKPDMNKTSLLS